MSDAQEGAGVRNRGESTPDDWEQLRASQDPESYFRAWLALQCGAIPEAVGGVVLIGAPDRGPYSPIAMWPRVHGDIKALTGAAERALSERRAIVVETQAAGGGASPRARVALALPIECDGALHGAAVLDVAPRSDTDLAQLLEQLEWGGAWIEVHLRRRADQQADAGAERVTHVIQLLAAVLECEKFSEAAMRLSTELATQLSCDRVSLGVLHRGRIELRAISHSAKFGKRTNLVRSLERAMDEAVEQQRTLLYPDPTPRDTQVVRAHGELAQEFGASAICSVPLVRAGEVVGALTLERVTDRPFDAEELALAEATAALTGPVLEIQRREDRSVVAKVVEGAAQELRDLVGPQHTARKIGVALVSVLLLFLLLARGDYRVTADAILEAEVQRAAVAPFDGYLAEAPVRAGDRVGEGDLLARIDDRDLAIERLRWLSEINQLRNQYRQARAERDAAQARILAAGVDRAQARLDLVEERLARTELRAPFDGVVVQGDLSQKLGAPVQRGDVLFEIAPLDAYRLALEVDESDVAGIAIGQQGQVVLAAAPGLSVPFAVESVTPVSAAREGQNYFRVEARLEQMPPHFHPGMEGVGKIELGRRSLVWIWVHPAIDWLRLTLWRWLP